MAATATATKPKPPARRPRWGEGREAVELLPVPAYIAEPGFATDAEARVHLARHAQPVSDALAVVARTIADPANAPAAVVVLDQPRRYAVDASAIDGPMFYLGDISRVVKFGVAGDLYMSDTPMEIATCARAVNRAWGDVLVYGLGMGLILPGLLRNPFVRSVTVLEIAPAAIELIEPVVRSVLTPAESAALTITVGDARRVSDRPDLARRFDTVWSDIWPDVSFCNVPEIRAIEAASRPLLRIHNDKTNKPAGRRRFVASWSVDMMRSHQLFRACTANDREASRRYAADAASVIGAESFRRWAGLMHELTADPVRLSEAVAFGLLIRRKLPSFGDGPVTDSDVYQWAAIIRDRCGGDCRRIFAFDC